MKKMYGKVKTFVLFMALFMITCMLTFAEEATEATKTQGIQDAMKAGGVTIKSGKGSQSIGSAFAPMVDFMIKFRTVIILVFAVVATVLFFAGVFKFLGNPELSQIINYIVGFAFVLVIAFAFYKFVDTMAGTEIPFEVIMSAPVTELIL